MKKFKSLSFALVVALLLTGVGPLRPAFAGCRGSSFANKTQVLISTTVSQPTTLMAAGSLGACQEVMLMLNWSGSGTKPNGEYMLLSDSTTGFSGVSTGTIRIPAGNSPSEFLDLGEYVGPLFAVVIGTTGPGVAPTVSLLKKK